MLLINVVKTYQNADFFPTKIESNSSSKLWSGTSEKYLCDRLRDVIKNNGCSQRVTMDHTNIKIRMLVDEERPPSIQGLILFNF